MDDVIDGLKFFFSILLIFIVGLALIAGLVAITQYNSCQVYEKMGIEVQYDFWTGCMANHPTFGWMPAGEYFKTMNLNIPQ